MSRLSSFTSLLLIVTLVCKSNSIQEGLVAKEYFTPKLIQVSLDGQTFQTLDSLNKAESRGLSGSRRKRHIDDRVYHMPTNKKEEVRKILACPKDFELVNSPTGKGKICLRIVYKHPDIVCPPYASKHEKGCFVSKPVWQKCPNGYLMDHKKCMKRETFPIQHKCPNDGSKFDHELKGCKKEFYLPPKCLPGYTYNSHTGKCEKYTPSHLKCPAEYTLSFDTQECIRETKTHPKLECPLHYMLDEHHSKCYKIVHREPYCPHPYEFDKLRRKCALQVDKILSKCPEGYSQSSMEHCTREIKVPITYTCPDGYVLTNKLCTKTIKLPPYCPEGFQFSRINPGTCEKIVPFTEKCPPHTTPVDSSGIFVTSESYENKGIFCEKTKEVEKIHKCPLTYTMHQGVCKKKDYYHPTRTCIDGCFREKKVPIQYVCPENTSFTIEIKNGKKNPICTRQDMVELCYTPVKCVPDRSDIFVLPQSLYQNECAEENHQNCKIVPQIYSFDAKPICTEGTLVDNSYCLCKIPVEPQPVCTMKGIYDKSIDKCVRIIGKYPDKVCPLGSNLKEDKCIISELVPPEITCPHGSYKNENDCCVETVPEIPGGNKEEIATPFPHCPPGTHLHGEYCLKTETIPLERVCPKDTYVRNNCCWRYTNLIHPPADKRYHVPFKTCEFGELTFEDKCHVVHKHPAIPTCNEGEILTSDKRQCIDLKECIIERTKTIVTSPIPICPKDARPHGNHCVIDKYIEPLQFCCKHCILKNHECIEEVPSQVECYQGELEHNQCVEKIFREPTIKIVGGCITKKTDCLDCEDPYVTECVSN